MQLLATSVLAVVATFGSAAAQSILAATSGLLTPARLIDFGAGLFPDATPLSTEFAGLTLSHASYFTAPAPNNNVISGFLANDASAGPPDTLRIHFAQTISDVSFVYHQVGASLPSTIRALHQGLTVDSFSVVWNETLPNNFFGFVEIALDEVQIDFVGDFRLDSLAFNPVGGAAWFPFNGNNVNPPSFGCVALPVLGETWQGTIFNTPNTLLTAIAYAPAGLGSPLPLFGGELLLNPAQPLVVMTGTTNYSLAIPAAASWVGTTLALQGLRLELVGGTPSIVPLNAMLLMVGL
ncbi:MAG TPA: hypothetical protein VFZ65_03945 [Planctomycetota bacterium]|nr:hypothetical protein [Planctomycetota bacterium]